MRNFTLAADNIRRFAERGIGIALDDIGTGHSSLNYVHKLPLTKIKIDRSFIVDIATNERSRSIVKTIVVRRGEDDHLSLVTLAAARLPQFVDLQRCTCSALI